MEEIELELWLVVDLVKQVMNEMREENLLVDDWWDRISVGRAPNWKFDEDNQKYSLREYR